MELGNYSLAEKFYDEAAPVLKSTLGENHPMYVQLLDHRANLYQAMGNRTAAESDYRAALELRKKIFGPNHVLVAATLRNYGRFLYARNTQESEKLLREAVDIYTHASDRPAFEYANTLLSLGEAERKRGDLADARQTLQKALDVAAQGLGANHPVYASVLASLALVQQAAHEYAEAEQGLRQAIAIVTESQGGDHPDLAAYLKDLAEIYEAQGKYADARATLSPQFRDQRSGIERHPECRLGEHQSKRARESRRSTARAGRISAESRRPIPRSPHARLRSGRRRKGRVLDHVRDWREKLRASSSVRCASG